MASALAVVATLVAIIVFSAPLCYMAYVGLLQEQRAAGTARERAEEE